MKAIQILFIGSLALLKTTQAQAQAELIAEPVAVEDSFYHAFLDNPDHALFGGVIKAAAKSSDPVEYLNKYTAKYNAMMEAELMKRGYTKESLKVANAASGLDQALYYADIWHTYSSKSRRFEDIPKVDFAGLPKVAPMMSSAQQEKIKKYANGALDSAYESANSKMELKKYDVSDRVFKLPLANGRAKEFMYKKVEVESSYEVKDGKTLVTLKIQKDMPLDAMDRNEEGFITSYDYDSTRKEAALKVTYQAPLRISKDVQQNKWDYSKVKLNDDASIHFENTIQYELKDSEDAKRFKALVPVGKFQLAATGANSWDISSSTLTLRIPGVTTVYDTTKPYVLVRKDREVLTGASPKDFKDEDFKGALYIGVPASGGSSKAMVDRLTDLKKQNKLSLRSDDVDALMKELKLDILPRSCTI